jgi:branched-chain amino acid transport system permease protein
VQTLLQLLIGGVLQGGIYALGAFGLSIIFGVLRILNVAHGDFLMLGGMLTWWLYTAWGLPPWAAVPVVLPLFFLVGLAVERTILRRLGGLGHHEFLVGSILITLGLALAIEDLTAFALAQPVKGIDYLLPPFRVGEVVVSSLRLILLLLIVVLTTGLHLFLRRSYPGQALRAVMEDRDGAALVGIDVGRASAMAFGLGIGLAGTAGIFFVTLVPVEPHIGIPLTLRYLAIIVLGGVGHLPGALAGSVILGLSESVVSFYVGAQWSLTVAFVVLVGILLLRPRGLAGA